MSLPKVPRDSVDALLASCQLPKTTVFTHKQLSAQYHSIYLLTLEDGSEAVLRVAGSHIPQRKTANEVGVMRWVQQHTTIAVPRILAYDSSTDNPLGQEYLLLERVPGVCVDTIYASLGPDEQLRIIRQIADFVLQLHQRPFSHIGGLALANDGSVLPGPVIEVRSWQAQDISRAWLGGESIDTLNVAGPFETWTACSIAKLQRSLYALQKHPKLARINAQLGVRVHNLIAALEEKTVEDEINDTPHVLAHKDMHMSNFMCNPESLDITGVLDWEFAQVTPLPLWDPGNFLLLCPAEDEDIEQGRMEQERAVALFKSECRARGAQHLVEAEKNDLQEAMDDAVEILGWIVRSVPLDKHKEMIVAWIRELEEAFEEFDV